MAETRIGIEKGKPAARGAVAPKAPAAAKASPGAKAPPAAKTAAPSVVIRRVRKRTEDEGVPTAAASTLQIGSRRVSTMVGR